MAKKKNRLVNCAALLLPSAATQFPCGEEIAHNVYVIKLSATENVTSYLKK